MTSVVRRNKEIRATSDGAGLASALLTLNSHGVLGITSHQIAPQAQAMEKHCGDVWRNVIPCKVGNSREFPCNQEKCLKSCDGWCCWCIPWVYSHLGVWRSVVGRIEHWREMQGIATTQIAKMSTLQVRPPNSECEHRYWRCDVSALQCNV